MRSLIEPSSNWPASGASDLQSAIRNQRSAMLLKLFIGVMALVAVAWALGRILSVLRPGIRHERRRMKPGDR